LIVESDSANFLFAKRVSENARVDFTSMLGFIRRKGHGDDCMTLMSTQITGAIVDSFCSLEVTQRFVSTTKDPPCECAFLMQGTDHYIIYDIQIVKGEQALIFNIRGLDDEELTQVGAYNTMAFGKSTNDILLNIGVVPSNTIVQVTYGVSFNGQLTSPTELSFDIPYNNVNSNTLAFMDVTVENAAGLSNARCSACSSTFSKAHLTFSKATITKQPIVLITTSRPIGSSAVSTVIDSDKYIGLSLIPEIVSNEVLSEIFFLADCSGSMSGEPIESVRQTLKFLTLKLPSSCYFQVIFFESSYRSVFKESVPVSSTSLSTLSASLSTLSATGGTELYEPLSTVYRTKPRAGYVRQIFILTDGQVDREADILALVAQNRGSQRIFSLGIGESVARAFIEELATRSTGHAVFVRAQNVKEAAIEQLKSALRPAVASPQIEVGDAVVELAPFPTPPLFSNSVSNVYIRTKDLEGAPILVTGSSKSTPFEMIITARHSIGKIELLKFHAFFNIKDLQDRIPLASPEDAKRLKASIISLSQQSGLISDFTALYTVLEGAQLHCMPSLGQERFNSYQPFTQGQCRGQERYRFTTIGVNSPPMHFSEFYKAGFTQGRTLSQDSPPGKSCQKADGMGFVLLVGLMIILFPVVGIIALVFHFFWSMIL
jgi:uncharacterized protein YegL